MVKTSRGDFKTPGLTRIDLVLEFCLPVSVLFFIFIFISSLFDINQKIKRVIRFQFLLWRIFWWRCLRLVLDQKQPCFLSSKSTKQLISLPPSLQVIINSSSVYVSNANGWCLSGIKNRTSQNWKIFPTCDFSFFGCNFFCTGSHFEKQLVRQILTALAKILLNCKSQLEFHS